MEMFQAVVGGLAILVTMGFILVVIPIVMIRSILKKKRVREERLKRDAAVDKLEYGSMKELIRVLVEMKVVEENHYSDAKFSHRLTYYENLFDILSFEQLAKVVGSLLYNEHTSYEDVTERILRNLVKKPGKKYGPTFITDQAEKFIRISSKRYTCNLGCETYNPVKEKLAEALRNLLQKEREEDIRLENEKVIEDGLATVRKPEKMELF